MVWLCFEKESLCFSFFFIVFFGFVMVLVTLAGKRLSGNTKTLRDFFNGGGDLPWWVVSTSIIATLVSAVTFISVPAAVFAPGGNLTYFQVVLGLSLIHI